MYSEYVGKRRNRRILIFIRQVAATIRDAIFWLGVRLSESPLPSVIPDPMCHWTPQVYLQNGI